MSVYEGLTNEQGERYTRVTFEGCVLGEYERTGYNDSDFYAIVWDEEKQVVRSFQYNSTRYAGGGNCQVDATPEVLVKARAYYKPLILATLRKSAEMEAKKLRKGDQVVVVKGKVAKGFEGRLVWIAYNGPLSHRCTLESDHGVRVWIESTNLEIIESMWKSRMPSEVELDKQAQRYVEQSNWYLITEGHFYQMMSNVGAKF